MPPAARLSDLHACITHPPVPLPIAEGSSTVMIGFLPAARVKDAAACPAQAKIVLGSPTVFIDYKMAARLGDALAPPGVIVTGCSTVNIGSTPALDALLAAAAAGIPFLDADCKLCEDV